MSHIPYTISRSGTFYYNRRVPKHAVGAYGQFIRHALSKDGDEAQAYAERLSNVLEASWCGKTNISPVDVSAVVESFKPRSFLLSEIAEEYLALRKIDDTPPRVALDTFISLVGDRKVSEYGREDARLFVRHLIQKGNKTATIRRRITSLSAILNYAFSEFDLDKRNPFTRLMIPGEGEDRHKRGTFTNDQLWNGYEEALASGSTVKLLMPLLGETGCRLAEIVGLRVEEIDLKQDLIHIRPNIVRRLKTRNSTRTLPIVGYARSALHQAVESSDGEWLFPRYIKDGTCKATHSSNALSKWLKRRYEGLTAHSLRHTMRDRLRAIECPMELIDQIGGWRTVGGVGVRYGRGYSIEQVRSWMEKVALRNPQKL